METTSALVSFKELEPPVVVCHPGGSQLDTRPRTVVIGPEGGFADDEIPDDLARWDLGSSVLRVETAAIVAAARLLG